MKLTKTQLKEMVRESVRQALQEAMPPSMVEPGDSRPDAPPPSDEEIMDIARERVDGDRRYLQLVKTHFEMLSYPEGWAEDTDDIKRMYPGWGPEDFAKVSEYMEELENEKSETQRRQGRNWD